MTAAHVPERVDYLRLDRTPLNYSAAAYDVGVDRQARGRRLPEQTGTWEPIRIHVYADELAQDVPSPTDLEFLRDGIIQAAVRWLALALRVRPVLGRLKFEQHCDVVATMTGKCVSVASGFQECGSATIPKEHFRDREYCPSTWSKCEVSPGGEGIPNADFALYVTARDTGPCKGGSTMAYASSCRQDAADRPIAGYFNFCKSHVLGGSRSWHAIVGLAVHEILHTLAFGSSLFAFFRDDDGNPRTVRDEQGFPSWDVDTVSYLPGPSTVMRTQLEDGTPKHYMVLPRVLDEARRHFGCPTLDKIPLEESGGDGTAFSHFDQRVFFTDVMAPQLTGFPRVSTVTLAVLEDSGWYKVDFALAGDFSFGKGAGCDFVLGSCVKDGETAFQETFCTSQNVRSCLAPRSIIGCTADRKAKAVCGNCLHEAPLPVKFQYFSNSRLGGKHSTMGYCPVWEAYRAVGNEYSYCREDHGESSSQLIGETFGAASRCILASVVSKEYVPTELAGSCREVSCEPGGWIRIRIGSEWVACYDNEEGKRKTARINGFVGDVVCPSRSAVCGLSGRPLGSCMFPGVLRHGRCVCPPGTVDEDCSKEDTVKNRQRFPFGLRYFQSELILEERTPLSQSAHVMSWPLKPSLVSGPTPERFVVEPPLPAGLLFNSADGSLTGVPTVATLRSPYTIRAVVANGGAVTTTLFITVKCNSGNPKCAAVDVRNRWDSRNGTVVNSTGEEVYRNADEDASRVYGGLLRMTLRTVTFHAIQLDPGLDSFVAGFDDIMSEVVGGYVFVMQLVEHIDDSVLVEFKAAASTESSPAKSFSVALKRLVTQLGDPSSTLYTSVFGGRYLVSGAAVALLAVTEDGHLKVWPVEGRPSGQSSWTAKLSDPRAWPTCAAAVLSVLSVFQLWVLPSVIDKCNLHRRHARDIATASMKTAWSHFYSSLMMCVGLLLAKLAMEEVFPALGVYREAYWYFNLTKWQRWVLMAASALFVISLLSAPVSRCVKCWIGSSHAERVPLHHGAQAQGISGKTRFCIACCYQTAGVAGAFATSGVIIVQLATCWPALPKAAKANMDFVTAGGLASWRTLLVIAALVLIGLSFIAAGVADVQELMWLQQQDERDNYHTTVGIASTCAGAGAAAAVLLAVAPILWHRFQSGFVDHGASQPGVGNVEGSDASMQTLLFFFTGAACGIYLGTLAYTVGCKRRRDVRGRQESSRHAGIVDPVVVGAQSSPGSAVDDTAAVDKDGAVAQLVAMGFGVDASTAALRKSSWNVARAAEALSASTSRSLAKGHSSP
eukprot:TRINITY_DN48684_c0_g1_i1.p1 TRINITY_DN48684_c0_g1~~TRINITY_DN48684_c0_g1_i1.p1  ORF type:complete len:1468 (-),score=220.05 TRINITY_DN48684_c0_g1_i1:16-3876(-)